MSSVIQSPSATISQSESLFGQLPSSNSGSSYTSSSQLPPAPGVPTYGSVSFKPSSTSTSPPSSSTADESYQPAPPPEASRSPSIGFIPSFTTSTDKFGRLTVIPAPSPSSPPISSSSPSSRTTSARAAAITDSTGGAIGFRVGAKKGMMVFTLAAGAMVASMWA